MAQLEQDVHVNPLLALDLHCYLHCTYTVLTLLPTLDLHCYLHWTLNALTMLLI